MTSSFSEFKNKEIIDVTDGTKIGYVDDLVFDTDGAAVTSIIIYGRLRFFGLFGREENLTIDWKDIEIIGEDTILVKAQTIKREKKMPKSNYFDKLFG